MTENGTKELQIKTRFSKTLETNVILVKKTLAKSCTH